MDQRRGNVGKAVLIAGPTAGGKSALALSIAEERGGVVINADSMQVYRELRVLSARPTAEEMARVPHRLFGHVAAACRYSTGTWLEDAAAVLREVEAEAEGRAPIFVGGTGLYFKALTEGIAKVPPIPREVRERLAEDAASMPPEALHEQLALVDPRGAERIRPSDPARILRALEVIRATGRPLHDWQREGSPPLLREEECERYLVEPPRDELYRRIEERVDRMIAGRAVEEAARLAALGLDPDLPAMKAIGVRPLIDHLAGRRSLADAAAAMKIETRRYAKRQLTWFRHQVSGWTVVT